MCVGRHWCKLPNRSHFLIIICILRTSIAKFFPNAKLDLRAYCYIKHVYRHSQSTDKCSKETLFLTLPGFCYISMHWILSIFQNISLYLYNLILQDILALQACTRSMLICSFSLIFRKRVTLSLSYGK